MRWLLPKLWLSLLVGACLVACHPALDPDTERAREANELSRNLMSPFCPGRTIADCSSPDAATVREEIRDALAAGESPDSIRRRIEMRFGDHVIGVPKEGIGWALPIGVLIAGAGLLAVALVRSVQRPRATEAPISPELERDLARELDDVEGR
ncbi:MAG TPA: cytochrome c-type biogenesis protein CcmH [Myxococcota bacterium]|nr:cytochrome c-type biogenesis protein CcmH [Myxococcota bacterium]